MYTYYNISNNKLTGVNPIDIELYKERRAKNKFVTFSYANFKDLSFVYDNRISDTLYIDKNNTPK